jgi:ketosteroid isomerase-like protein
MTTAASGARETMGSDEAVIRRMLEEWAAAVRDRDIDRVVRDRAENVLLFDVVPPLRVEGVSAYRSSWEDQFFPWMGARGSFRLSEIDVHAGERVAFATALIDCAGQQAGNEVALRVRLTVGLVKQEGRWRVAHEHHSEVVSPPAAASGR